MSNNKDVYILTTDLLAIIDGNEIILSAGSEFWWGELRSKYISNTGVFLSKTFIEERPQYFKKKEEPIKERVEVTGLFFERSVTAPFKGYAEDVIYILATNGRIPVEKEQSIRLAIEKALNPNTDTVFDHEKINKRLDELTEHEAAFNAAREMYEDSPNTPFVIQQSHGQIHHNFINLCKYKTFQDYCKSIAEQLRPMYEEKDTQVEKEEEYMWLLSTDRWHAVKVKACDAPFAGDKEQFKYFPTKEAAEEYILQNKPCLSLNDLLDVWYNDTDQLPENRERYATSQLFGNFLQKAKTILNGK